MINFLNSNDFEVLFQISKNKSVIFFDMQKYFIFLLSNRLWYYNRLLNKNLYK